MHTLGDRALSSSRGVVCSSDWGDIVDAGLSICTLRDEALYFCEWFASGNLSIHLSWVANSSNTFLTRSLASSDSVVLKDG